MFASVFPFYFFPGLGDLYSVLWFHLQYDFHMKLDVLGHSQRPAKEHQEEQLHKLFISVSSTACRRAKFHALVPARLDWPQLMKSELTLEPWSHFPGSFRVVRGRGSQSHQQLPQLKIHEFNHPSSCLKIFMAIFGEVELFKISQSVSSRDEIRAQSTSSAVFIPIINLLTDNIMARWHGQAVRAACLLQSIDAMFWAWENPRFWVQRFVDWEPLGNRGKGRAGRDWDLNLALEVISSVQIS